MFVTDAKWGSTSIFSFSDTLYYYFLYSIGRRETRWTGWIRYCRRETQFTNSRESASSETPVLFHRSWIDVYELIAVLLARIVSDLAVSSTSVSLTDRNQPTWPISRAFPQPSPILQRCPIRDSNGIHCIRLLNWIEIFAVKKRRV